MVEITRLPRRLVVSETPKSSLTHRDLDAASRYQASQYESLSKDLTAIGGALEDVAVPFGEKAGYQSATIDENGDLKSTPLPIVGKAGLAFDHAAKLAAVTRGDEVVDKDLLDLRQAHEKDPEGFRTAAEAYKERKVAQFRDAGGEAVGLAIEKSINNNSTSIYRGLLSQKQSLDIARDTAALNASIETDSDRLEEFGRKGLTGTPEYEETYRNFRAKMAAKVANPLYRFPQEVADRVIDQTATRVQGAAILYSTERVYQTPGVSEDGKPLGGFDAARTHLRESVKTLEGRVKDLDKIERHGLSWLKQEESAFRGERNQMNREWLEIKRIGVENYPPDALDDFIRRSSEIGNTRGVQDASTERAALDIVANEWRGLPATDKANVLTTGTLPAPTAAAGVPVEGAPAEARAIPGDGTDLTTTPAGRAALRMMKQELAKGLPAQIHNLSEASKKMEFPPIADITALASQVAAIGTQEQKRQVADLLALAEHGQEFRALGDAERQTILSRLEDKKQAGGVSGYDLRLSEALNNGHKTITAAYKNDPYNAYERFTAGAKRQPFLDWSSPDIEKQLAQKVSTQSQIRASEGMEEFSIFKPIEAKQFAQILTSGDPKAAAGVIGLLSKSLPGDVFEATMTDKVIKPALRGMTLSSEPERVNAGFGVMERIWREDQAAFAREFPNTEKSLQTWLANKDWAKGQELVDVLRRADDPAQQKARETMHHAAQTELKAWKLDHVITAFDKAGAPEHTFLGRVFGPTIIGGGTGSSAPINTTVSGVFGGQQELFNAEFHKSYTEFRGRGLTADQASEAAAKGLHTSWGVSAVNNGALTRLPPEKYYTKDPRTGDYSWMNKQVNEIIRTIHPDKSAINIPSNVSFGEWVNILTASGPEQARLAPGSTHTFVALVGDTDTEAEIANKIPPAYNIVVRNTLTGKDEVLVSPTGKKRFAFDPRELEDVQERRQAPVTEASRRMNQALADPRAAQAEMLRNVREAVRGAP